VNILHQNLIYAASIHTDQDCVMRFWYFL